ncbi:hypothetical protein [Paraflavitalea pollutisoli]|uniref:hypothetical protein n=1 Tax=Paraflavitalea pollutisoli TaxID=3034143 RepID=UPI0023EB7A50|nr:hypothetical protein [Paraflavitalea sp. H1-2-19X]
MKKVVFVLSFCSCLLGGLFAQTVRLDKSNLLPVGAIVQATMLDGKNVAKVIKDSSVTGFDEPTFALLKGVTFKDGIIEARVLSRLLPNAPAMARGFIGIAFRVCDSVNKFECIYIRPTNGRADNQLRRNRSIQYFSYPGYTFERFRKENPGEYESYADMGLNEWISLKIVVKGMKAQLYLNNSKQPVLIVNDLKLGADLSGTIGLWVDIGTEGYFSDVKITRQD